MQVVIQITTITAANKFANFCSLFSFLIVVSDLTSDFRSCSSAVSNYKISTGCIKAGKYCSGNLVE